MKHCRSFALRALQSSTALSLVFFSYTASAQVQPQQLPSVEINLGILERLANSEVFNVISENEIAQINETIAKAEAEAVAQAQLAEETLNDQSPKKLADKPKLDDLVPYKLDNDRTEESILAPTKSINEKSTPVEIAPLDVLTNDNSVPSNDVVDTEVTKEIEIKEIAKSDAVIITKAATDEEIKKSKEIIEEKKTKKTSLFSLFSRKKDNKKETPAAQQPQESDNDLSTIEAEKINPIKLVEPTPKTDVIVSNDLATKAISDNTVESAKVTPNPKINDSVVVSPFNPIDQVELIELQDSKPANVELVSKPIDLSKDEQELASIGEKEDVIEKFIDSEQELDESKPIETNTADTSITNQVISQADNAREERKKSWFSSLKNILKKPKTDSKEPIETSSTKTEENNNLHVVDITPLDSIKSDTDKTPKDENIPVGDIEPVQIILPNRIDDDVVADNVPLPVLKEVTPPANITTATKTKKEVVKPTTTESLEEAPKKPVDVAKVANDIKAIAANNAKKVKVVETPIKKPALEQANVAPSNVKTALVNAKPKNVILPNEVKPVKDDKKDLSVDFNVHKTDKPTTSDALAPVNIIDFEDQKNEVIAKIKPLEPTAKEQKVLTVVEEVKAKDAELDISNNDKTKQALPNGALLALDFLDDSTIVTEENRERLSKLAGDILRDNNKKIKIISYAKSSDGHPSSSRRISLQRAIAIRSHLINAGFPSVRINVQAVGDKARSAGELANSSYLYLIQN